jgi:hypothetical protein
MLRAAFAAGMALVGVVVAASQDPGLRERLKDTEAASEWIYDDVTAGFARAKETGKPLLVYLRCVP